ncbi:uncharacterized protein LOC118438971 [Folsomia candida]|uniref:uncharacterized protein LOC118438971 n=1 Tax=Folsomia candida TaxID=158441 RepID=UPI0016053FF5|nr:uncharacterized protein LOC118438971 [Folsomia candida]
MPPDFEGSFQNPEKLPEVGDCPAPLPSGGEEQSHLQGEPRPGRWVKLLAKAPFLMVHTVVSSLTLDLTRHPFREGKQAAPTTTPSEVMHYAKESMDLARFKQISKSSGCKLSAIFMSVFLTTFRRWVAETPRFRGKSSTSDQVFLCEEAPLMFILPAPNHPADKGVFCNHALLCFIPVPLRENDKLKQLQTIHQRYQMEQGSPHGTASLLLKSVFGPLIPITLLDFGARMGSHEGFELAVNPFMMSHEKYEVVGVGVKELFVMQHSEFPIVPIGVGITPLTAGGQVTICLQGDDEIFQDSAEAELFLKNFVEEAHSLGEEVEKCAYNINLVCV